MQTNIRYKGISLVRDEQAVQPGDTSLLGGVEIHDAAVRASVLVGTETANALVADGLSCTLLYVHETSSYRHFIGLNGTSIYWFAADGTLGNASAVVTLASGVTVSSVSSVGNTLVVLASDGVHYVLWQSTAASYKYLGQKPPYIELDFTAFGNYSEDYEVGGGVDYDGAEGEMYNAFQQTEIEISDVVTEGSEISKSDNSEYAPGDTVYHIKPEQQSMVTEQAWALINRSNARVAKSGRFYANFFVRYCYRLYDGSMIMHSAPVFIPVLVPDNYVVYVINSMLKADNKKVYHDDGRWTSRETDTHGVVHEIKVSKFALRYHPRSAELLMDTTDVSSAGLNSIINDWSDIVKSVDIFVSVPVTRTDSSELIKTCSVLSDNYYNSTTAFGKAPAEIYTASLDGIEGTESIALDFPGLSDEAYSQKIRKVSAFYRIKSLRFEEIADVVSAGATGLVITPENDVSDDTVSTDSVATLEAMTDDYKSHNILYADGQYVYNHRLNLFNMKEALFEGFHVFNMGLSTRRWYPYTTTDRIFADKVVARINTEQGYKYVEKNKSWADTDTDKRCFKYLLYNMPKFYPDSRCDKLYVRYFTMADPARDVWAEFDMTPCNELNGSMHVGTFTSDYPVMSAAPVYSTDDNIVSMPNKVYTSEVNNPYFFPLEGINTVGTGSIIALAAATRALSQGQFGQFPLMAFSSDGIWAMSIASTGTISAVHPISREVCVNPDSIVQLDQSVVFATDRGLNKIVESSVASFTDMLDGPLFSPLSSFLGFQQLLAVDFPADYTSLLQLLSFGSEADILNYFKQGRILHDYANNRLIVIPAQASDTGNDIVLVYSIRDGAWSTMLMPHVAAIVNSYPYSFVQYDSARTVLTLDENYDYSSAAAQAGIIVTRSFSPGGLATVQGFTQYESLQSHAVVYIYGSNDNRTWHYVGRSSRVFVDYLPSRPYRFFRLAVAMCLSPAERYHETELNFQTKFHRP